MIQIIIHNHRSSSKRGITHAFRIMTSTIALGACGLVFAQPADEPAPRPVVKVLSSVPTSENQDGKPGQVTTFELTLAPGAAGTPHRHPGPIYGYVLEGEFEFQAGDEPEQRLKAGDTFYEPAMALHGVSRNPSKTAQTKVLAIMVHARDAKDLVIPVETKEAK